MSKPSDERYIFRFRARHQADDPRGIRRVRLALKLLGRTFGLDCEECRPAHDGESIHARPESSDDSNPTTETTEKPIAPPF